MSNYRVPRLLAASLAVCMSMSLSACNAESDILTSEVSTQESATSHANKYPEKEIMVTGKPVSVRKGAGTFLEIADALVRVQTFSESPENFYEKIKICRLARDNDECAPFLHKVQLLLDSLDANRDSDDFESILRKIRFNMTEPPKSLVSDAVDLSEPASSEKPGD